eukprot:scaffold4587_cov144-Skeletonema_dohrnii-CCMP3373.AAC.5
MEHPEESSPSLGRDEVPVVCTRMLLVFVVHHGLLSGGIKNRVEDRAKGITGIEPTFLTGACCATGTAAKH